MAMRVDFADRMIHSRGPRDPLASHKVVRAQAPGRTLARLASYLGSQKGPLVAVALAVVASTGFGLMAPYLIAKAVDAMAGPGKTNFPALGDYVALAAAFYILGALATWVQTWVMVKVAQTTVRNLRRELFAHVQTLSLPAFDRRPHGELMSRLTNDVENINATLSQNLTQIVSSVITLVGTFGLMLWLQPLLTLVALAAVPLGLWATSRMSRATKVHFQNQQAQLGDLNGFVEEQISGLRINKAFGREEASVEAFRTRNDALCGSGTKAQFLSGVVPPLMGLVNNIGYLLVAVAGGVMALQGWVTVGLIAGFTIYAKQFGRPISELANQYNMIQSAIAGAERVFETLDEPSEFDPADVDAPGAVRGEVEFRHVWFSYVPGQPVLKDVCLRAEPGQTVALVGPTGAGKTTVVNLLTRFYDLDSGAILVDGRDLATQEKRALRRRLGLVLQESHLFSTTIRENIRYGRLDATDDEVVEAARLANVDGFVSRLPQGYDTVLGDDATNLSQGQRQLLTIARAVLADPAILVLDEATSSVDTRTEVHIQAALRNLRKGRTCFVIAHRLSTIRTADLIVVVDHGTIVERGSHQELLSQRGLYHRLYHNQFRPQGTPSSATRF